MTYSIAEWHKRFRQQAGWTASVREYLFKGIKDFTNLSVLEVGCGTGAIIENLRNEILNPTRRISNGIDRLNLFGVDINRDFLIFAKDNCAFAFYTLADGISLPFEDATFDISYTHFLLMWVNKPVEIIKEIARVTKPGCYVFAFAEPDYGGRIDYPDELGQISKAQINSLQNQGANPFYGRKLSAQFMEAGLKDIEIGVLGGNWKIAHLISGSQSEWQAFLSDLEFTDLEIDLESLRKKEERFRKEGKRVLFVPTFYASGKKFNP